MASEDNLATPEKAAALLNTGGTDVAANTVLVDHAACPESLRQCFHAPVGAFPNAHLESAALGPADNWRSLAAAKQAQRTGGRATYAGRSSARAWSG